MSLPQAQDDVVGPDGQPRHGRYAGLANNFGWDTLAAPFMRRPLWRRLHRKRWHFVALATDELFCAAAVVDVGWGTSTFGYAFDRAGGRDIESFSLLGLPGMGAQVGGSARGPSSFRWVGGRIAIAQAAPGSWSLSLRARRFHIEASYGGEVDYLLAIGEADGGSAHATQKSPALPLQGFAEAGGRRFGLDGGVASFDYSNGLLARDTEWCWLSAHSLEVGINLQQGYFGAAENALWLDGRALPLGAALLEAQSGLRAWRVRTEDGLVDLVFTPEGTRRDDKQLLVASSHLTQQIGVFDGWVKAAPDAAPRPVRRLVGVVEQHRARW